MDRNYLPRKNESLIVIILVLAVFTGSAFAGSKYRVIHRFQPTGPVGSAPTDLIADPAGNLYGTANIGGKFGFGTLYELTPPGTTGGPWTTTVLYSFPNGSTIYNSAGAGSLILDPSGNLYGVTTWGGHRCSIFGCGTVFRLTPPSAPGSGWSETDLYIFSGWDGFEPGGLVLDKAGNLYGTTGYGGRGCRAIGCGTVFQLTPSAHGRAGTKTLLYFFKGVLGDRGSGDGATPLSVIFDGAGNLYGTTASGGNCQLATCYGTVFELKPPTAKSGHWTETVLYRFPISGDQDQPFSGVILDQSGALYGSTVYSVYQLALAKGVWTENILTSGAYIYSGVILDGAGNLYGTTDYSRQYTNGTVYKLSPPGKDGGGWSQTALHVFAGGRDGEGPAFGVTFGLNSALYGTTSNGGTQNECSNFGCGTVFTVAP